MFAKPNSVTNLNKQCEIKMMVKLDGIQDNVDFPKGKSFIWKVNVP